MLAAGLCALAGSVWANTDPATEALQQSCDKIAATCGRSFDSWCSAARQNFVDEYGFRCTALELIDPDFDPAQFDQAEPEPPPEPQPPEVMAATPPWPACYLQGPLQRFADPVYFALMAGDGIASAQGGGLRQIMQRAHDNGEHYKALYFARLLTDKLPDDTGAWTIRADSAAMIGLLDEAEAARSNQAGAAQLLTPPVSMLPGKSYLPRPATLSDWAAAVRLMADDLASATGEHSLLAVVDVASGIRVSTQAETEVTGSTAQPVAVRVRDVLNNAFQVVAAQPMSPSSGDEPVAVATVSPPAPQIAETDWLANLEPETADAVARALAGPASFDGGEYRLQTWAEGTVNDEVRRPVSSGGDNVIGGYHPIIFASGHSLDPTFAFERAYGGHANRNVLWTSDDETRTFGDRNVALQTPKLEALCIDRRCSEVLSTMELMLDFADIRLVVPAPNDQAVIDNVPQLSEFHNAYNDLDRNLHMCCEDARGVLFWALGGYDEEGTCYYKTVAPDEWVVPIAPVIAPGPQTGSNSAVQQPSANETGALP
ncbi:MAG: hypothetical protein HKN49_01755 [Gammaproteobacteria bacterium]|nr:hypothetical protein [Gammaproteobacteria bacterium]